jgi:serine phosphatase RsbU (regulator of sigma subunit)
MNKAKSTKELLNGQMQLEAEFHAGLGLKTKFLIWLVIFIISVMVVVYIYFSHHQRRTLSNEIKLRGQAICNNLKTSAEDFLVMQDDLALAKLVYDTKNTNEGIVHCFVVDDKGTIWAHSDMSLVNTKYTAPEGLEELENNLIRTQPHEAPDGIETFEIAMPIKVGEKKIGEAHVAISQQAIKEAVTQSGKGIAFVTGGIIVLGVIGILILVSFIIGSLGEVTRDIEAIGNGDLDRNIMTQRRDEIGRITHAVKTMSKKLKIARTEIIEKERMKKEMQIAKDIQQTLLPHAVPQIPEFKIASYYQSAMEVGGDYYDFIELDKDHFGLIIADVSGKGVAGSLVMTMVRSIMRIEASKNESPHRLLNLLNAILSGDIPEGMFITMFYTVFDLTKHEIRYCCAGHNPAYVYGSSESRLYTLKSQGPPLGVNLFDEKEYASRLKEETRPFRQGDMLFVYTDGVTESMNNKRKQFGQERLEALIKENSSLSPDILKSTLKKNIETFTGGEQQSDDITFVIIKRE